jgi:hypothetical protein
MWEPQGSANMILFTDCVYPSPRLDLSARHEMYILCLQREHTWHKLRVSVELMWPTKGVMSCQPEGLAAPDCLPADCARCFSATAMQSSQ